MSPQPVPQRARRRRGPLRDRSGTATLRVAFDVTPLIGPRTGVGNLVAGFHNALMGHEDLELVVYATTLRGRAAIAKNLHARIAPLPARLLRSAWMRIDAPSVECWSGPVDMVHGMNYVVPPTRSDRSLASVHDLTFVHFPTMCTKDTLQYPGILRRAFRRGAHVHVDSEFVGREVVSWSGLDPERIHVVNPGLVPLQNAPAEVGGSPEALDELLPASWSGRLRGRPFVLGLGTVEPRKDYPTLVRAFAELAHLDDDLVLVIAGTEGWGSSALDEAEDRLPAAVRARILKLGYVSEVEKVLLLKRARVLAYPSVYEGFGLPPLEAMQHRTPVVSSVAGSLPEVLADAALFVEVGDHMGLAEQLLRAHNDDALRSELVARGNGRVARYTWQRAGSELLSVYRAVVESTTP